LNKYELNSNFEGDSDLNPSSKVQWPRKPNHSPVNSVEKVASSGKLLDPIHDSQGCPDVRSSPSVENAEAAARRDIRHLEALIEYLEGDFGYIKLRTDDLLLKNKVAYHFLWCLFPIGSEVVFQDPHSGVNCAGRVYILFSC
jgi:hypothetical protein